MRVSFSQMKYEFKRVLSKYDFSENKAELCADIFTGNSLDGIYSHGLNRFPVFIGHVKEKLVLPQAEPETLSVNGVMELWDGHLAPGMYTATMAMKRAIELSKLNGMGAIAVRNTNHWMRGGTYGWQAANEGCIGICTTNTIANMPPWGGREPRLGNNPIIIAIPWEEGNIVLDMAVSQFSYGKLQEYQLNKKQLPVEGGYDNEGNLTKEPASIRKSKRSLPIGFWKGSGLSLMMDLLVTLLSDGRSTASITGSGKEFGLSQFFLSIHPEKWNNELIGEIIEFIKSSELAEGAHMIRYPGEGSLATRNDNLKNGIPVQEEIWKQVMEL